MYITSSEDARYSSPDQISFENLLKQEDLGRTLETARAMLHSIRLAENTRASVRGKFVQLSLSNLDANQDRQIPVIRNALLDFIEMLQEFETKKTIRICATSKDVIRPEKTLDDLRGEYEPRLWASTALLLRMYSGWWRNGI